VKIAEGEGVFFLGLPLKSDEQNPVLGNNIPPIPLISALIRAGLVKPGEMTGMVGRRMLAAAKLLAVNPKANYCEAGRVLGITRQTAKERLVLLRAKIETGELDLRPYAAGDDEDFEGGDVGDIGDIESGDMVLETIRAEERKLWLASKAGKSVSANQLKQLADAKAKIMALPSMQGEQSRDFYDQIFDRVPAVDDPECPHCRSASAAREAEEYEAMGRAGDLGAVALEGEAQEEDKSDLEVESEYEGAFRGPKGLDGRRVLE
jgi:hypothetical protein